MTYHNGQLVTVGASSNVVALCTQINRAGGRHDSILYCSDVGMLMQEMTHQLCSHQQQLYARSTTVGAYGTAVVVLRTLTH
jgi:malic enzyme